MEQVHRRACSLVPLYRLYYSILTNWQRFAEYLLKYRADASQHKSYRYSTSAKGDSLLGPSSARLLNLSCEPGPGPNLLPRLLCNRSTWSALPSLIESYQSLHRRYLKLTGRFISLFDSIVGRVVGQLHGPVPTCSFFWKEELIQPSSRPVRKRWLYFDGLCCLAPSWCSGWGWEARNMWIDR